MALVLLLCPSWATSCYRSAPTRLLTHRSLQGVGHASEYSDSNIRTYTKLGLSCEQQADISLLITVQCVCVMVALLVGYVVFGHDFSSWKPIIRQHRMLPRKGEVKERGRVVGFLCGFHKLRSVEP